jgi:flagellum-specific peptidoglycan hydrolase FlgJ
MSDFANTILPLAQEVYKKTGVLPSVTIAQAWLETGGTLNNLLAKGFNFFGEKGKGDKGSISAKTWEMDSNGNSYNTYADFKVYSSPTAGAQGRINLLNQSNFKNVGKATTFTDQIKLLKAGGYATDSAYVSKLESIYKLHNLSQYDSKDIKVESNTPIETTKNNNEVSNLNVITEANKWSQNTFFKPMLRTLSYITLLIIIIIATFKMLSDKNILTIAKEGVTNA